MKTREVFNTKEEADAFVYGLNYVGDLDVSSTAPTSDIYGKWIVVVIVGEDPEDE